MSPELIDRPDLGYTLTRFHGGDVRGPCVQLTGEEGYVQLTRTAARTLIQDLIGRFLRTLPTVGDATAALVDETGVEDLALAMKEKLGLKREEGRGGWYDNEKCPAERLALMLLDHLPKGDPVDIANFAMFIHNRADAKGIITEVFPVWLAQQQNAALENALADTANARLERNRAQEEVKELKAAQGRLEGERNEARRQMEKAAEMYAKELAHLNDRLLQSEQNLSRALGYIDRVTEGEPPLGLRREEHQRAGEVAVSYVSGPEPRGPKLSLGEPYRDNDQYIYRR